MSRAESADDFYYSLFRRGNSRRPDRRPAPQPAAPSISDRSRYRWYGNITPLDRADGSSLKRIEFFAAVQEFKRTSGRPLPTWAEILEVLEGLGYERASKGESPPSASPLS